MKSVHKHVNKTLKLRHHKHTGKILAHRHTSYRVLFLLLLAPILLMTLVSNFEANAEEFLSVTATIPAPIPGGTPTIDAPVDGTVVHTNQLTVSGTCPVITPAVIIVIYDGPTVIGSEECDVSGQYSLPVSLTYGQHSLVATVVTFTGDHGQSSTPPVGVTYPAPPAPPAPSPTPTPAPTSKPKPTPSVEPVLPLSASVRIIPQEAFVAIKASGKVTWTGRVEGGTPPYHMRAEWGDGTVDQRTVFDHSLQTFTHIYKTARVYALLIKATDAEGVTTVLQSTAVTATARQGVAQDEAKYESIPPVIAFIDKNAWYIVIGLISSVVFLWYLEHGRHRLRRHVKRTVIRH